MKNPSFRLHQSLAILACTALCISKSPSVSALSAAGNKTDWLALLAFKDRITQDPLSVMSSWNSSIHFCQWLGVFCSNQHPRRVSVLNLQSKKLTGSMPPHLKVINLGDNDFQGPIPQELGRLSRLQNLNLSKNAFEGEIPSNLSYCSDKQGINLNYNNLVSEIPYQLSYLSTKKLSGLLLATSSASMLEETNLLVPSQFH